MFCGAITQIRFSSSFLYIGGPDEPGILSDSTGGGGQREAVSVEGETQEVDQWGGSIASHPKPRRVSLSFNCHHMCGYSGTSSPVQAYLHCHGHRPSTPTRRCSVDVATNTTVSCTAGTPPLHPPHISLSPRPNPGRRPVVPTASSISSQSALYCKISETV